MPGKVNVHIHIGSYTLEELAALRVKIQSFLDSEAESGAKLLTFSYTEQEEE